MKMYEVRGSDPGTLQNRNLLVKMYEVSGSESTKNTIVFRSSDITGNKTGSRSAGANDKTWSLSLYASQNICNLVISPQNRRHA